MRQTLQPLYKSIHHLYEPLGLRVTTPPHMEREGQAYSAAHFSLEKQALLFRIGKKTATKAGYFLTLWKRKEAGTPILPYDSRDQMTALIVHIADQSNQGQFIFPREILIKKGIFSHNGSGGKRAFRVYPPWVAPPNVTAQKSQQWQAPYFLTLNENYQAPSKKVASYFSFLLPPHFGSPSKNHETKKRI